MKIAITGPESSGKTQLSLDISSELGIPFIPEFARSYLFDKEEYHPEDVKRIAAGQASWYENLSKEFSDSFICDSDFIVLEIWHEVKYGRCELDIHSLIEKCPFDLYLLCVPDLPWEFDPQRENPNDREMLLQVYKEKLSFYNLNFEIVYGIGELRTQKALEHIKNHAQKNPF